MDSIFKLNSTPVRFPSLTSDEKTDVLIIGGGIAGILCAHMLNQAGVDYILCEQNKIGGGVTERSSAKITAQHGLIYDEMLERYGKDFTRLYYKANSEAILEYGRLAEGIDCDFEKKDAFVYSLDDYEKIKKEANALRSIGCNAEICKQIPLPFDIAGAVMMPGQAQFNPLKFIYGISKDLNIYENTKVTELMPGAAITNRGKISAKRIIIATHFPILNKHGWYFAKMYQYRSYIIAIENGANVDGMYVDEAEGGMSFRSYKDALLVGGGGHRTGRMGASYTELEKFIKKHYPNAKEITRCATQDCMTLDNIAYVGKYSEYSRGLYVITGFNKWGMTAAMMGARLLSDELLGKKNSHAHLFDPSRRMVIPSLCKNLIHSAIGLLTPGAPRCPHLGCKLKYNKAEHSWDCPCHGSRFAEDGRVLDNPATDDLKRD